MMKKDLVAFLNQWKPTGGSPTVREGVLRYRV